ncbi:hypothetical protein [Streptomyces sp. NPDC052042]|uniref:hypothetical protein n=1 Tax=Streptomyces sp. NPDC052042 TaxID=3365683 RepID=UPI0037CF192E
MNARRAVLTIAAAAVLAGCTVGTPTSARPEAQTSDGYGNGITVIDLTGKRPPAKVNVGARLLGIAVL